jgi:hypothetical protein
MELRKLWTAIEADLSRARGTLPNAVASHSAIREYEEFLDHNELELACDALETYAKTQAVSREFWLALRDAATKMKLQDREQRYEGYAGVSNQI